MLLASAGHTPARSSALVHESSCSRPSCAPGHPDGTLMLVPPLSTVAVLPGGSSTIWLPGSLLCAVVTAASATASAAAAAAAAAAAGRVLYGTGGSVVAAGGDAGAAAGGSASGRAEETSGCMEEVSCCATKTWRCTESSFAALTCRPPGCGTVSGSEQVVSKERTNMKHEKKRHRWSGDWCCGGCGRAPLLTGAASPLPSCVHGMHPCWGQSYAMVAAKWNVAGTVMYVSRAAGQRVRPRLWQQMHRSGVWRSGCVCRLLGTLWVWRALIATVAWVRWTEWLCYALLAAFAVLPASLPVPLWH